VHGTPRGRSLSRTNTGCLSDLWLMCTPCGSMLVLFVVAHHLLDTMHSALCPEQLTVLEQQEGHWAGVGDQ
jgi:hypothetical protein